MRDRETRMDIKYIKVREKEHYEYVLKSLTDIHIKINALMTHLGLEFEDVKPGVIVRKKK